MLLTDLWPWLVMEDSKRRAYGFGKLGRWGSGNFGCGRRNSPEEPRRARFESSRELTGAPTHTDKAIRASEESEAAFCCLPASLFLGWCGAGRRDGGRATTRVYRIAAR